MYNLGYLYEMERKKEKSIKWYINASNNAGKPFVFNNMNCMDKKLRMSENIIIYLTNLKLIEYYLLHSNINESKKYFLKLFIIQKDDCISSGPLLLLQNNQIRFFIQIMLYFTLVSYLQYQNFDFMEIMSAIFFIRCAKYKYNQNFLNKTTEKMRKIVEEVKIQPLKTVSNNTKNQNDINENNGIVDTNVKKVKNIIELFDFLSKDNKKIFLEIIHHVIKDINAAFCSPPFNILFGRIPINLFKKKMKKEINQCKKNIDKFFYEGIGLDEFKFK